MADRVWFMCYLGLVARTGRKPQPTPARPDHDRQVHPNPSRLSKIKIATWYTAPSTPKHQTLGTEPYSMLTGTLEEPLKEPLVLLF